MKGILKVMARLEAKAGRLMHPLRGEGLPQIFALRRNTPGDGELLFFGGQWHKSRRKFIGSRKRTVYGQIWASGTAGPRYPQRLPCPALRQLPWLPDLRCCLNHPLLLWELSPAGPSAFWFSFALLEAGRVLPSCR